MNSRWILKLPLQNYDIYFTNEELTDEQKSLIEWYRDVFRPEDLRLVERTERAEIAWLSWSGAHHVPTVAVAEFPNMVSPISIICWRRCLRTNDISGGIFRRWADF